MRRRHSRLPMLAALVVFLASPGSAPAHEERGAAAAEEHGAVAAAEISEPCPPDSYYPDAEPIEPDRVITGKFAAEREGSFVFLPFRVPQGQTALRVRYCFDQPELAPESAPGGHTLDLGLYEPRVDRSGPWGVREFRGWGGSSHRDVTLSPQGYSSEREYRDQEWVPGRTTRAFEPGPIRQGRWAVELGLASIASQDQGDPDGRVGYRVEIDWQENASLAADPYEPAPYDRRSAVDRPGWYAGDFHVHGEHSALGDAAMSEVFDYAFGSLEEGKAGLDFVTLSDYVSGASWDEVGRYQEDYPDNLIIRSAEVITYRGHANSHANTRVVDYRTGPLYVRRSDGLDRLRDARPASAILDRIHRAGGFTQINHPTIFPSAVPLFASFCRGCPWDYSDRQTDYSKVDAIEIATGPPGLEEAPGDPGPNPFTVTAIRFWEDALAAGHKIAAVGSSDSHNAGRTEDPVTQAPIGTATTVVRAPELSEEGIRRAVRAGHTYVKVFGNAGPDLRLRATAMGSGGQRAIMGDTLRAERGEFTARVLGGGSEGPSAQASSEPLELLVMRNGVPFRAAVVTDDPFTLGFVAERPGRYRLQLQRGTAIEAVSSPIYLERSADQPGGGGGEDDPPGDEPPAAGDEAPAEGGGAGPGRSASPGGATLGAQTTGALRGKEAGALPFTGLGLAAIALLAAVLLGIGVGLRRVTHKPPRR